ncbi:hypothetical protein EKK58_08510 [Candidatus Dependentiae bacterium]|nr:MAG: hypothetical protein EKK58_08510 [Candidatus Dependentiae bacterium]
MKYPSLLSSLIETPNTITAMINNMHRINNQAALSATNTILSTCLDKQDAQVKSYVVSESLCDALATVDCSEVGKWHMVGFRCHHFILPKGQLADDRSEYREMYVAVLPPRETHHSLTNSLSDQYKICITLVEEYTKEQLAQVYIGSRYSEGSTVEEIVKTGSEAIAGSTETGKEFTEKTLRLALNLLLYLESPDPDIMNLKPQVYNTRNFRENYFKKCKSDRALMGIYSLGWDFHGREYSVHIGVRKGHFKWQPCGKLWAQRKLIYVAETTVNYRREDNVDTQ